MKEKPDKLTIKDKKSRTASPKLRTNSPRPRTSEKKSHFSVSPTVKEFQEMRIKCEEEIKQEPDDKSEIVTKEEICGKIVKQETKNSADVPVVVPIRKGRKGSKWQASGFITKLGDQILSYTAESGITYRKGGNKEILLCSKLYTR